MIIHPNYLNIYEWFDSLHESYPTEYLPLLNSKDNWHNIGAIIAQTGVFFANNVPSPLNFSPEGKKKSENDWRQWANKVYNIMNSIN